jgi:hypothetical protein
MQALVKVLPPWDEQRKNPSHTGLLSESIEAAVYELRAKRPRADTLD